MTKRHGPSLSRATFPQIFSGLAQKPLYWGGSRASDDDDDEDDDDLMRNAPPFRIFGSLSKGEKPGMGALDIYISRDIVAPAAYDELCHILRQADETDKITLYLNSPGGDITGGMAIIQAMWDCPATIKTVLHPCAHSMGAMIFLAGDEHEVPLFAHMMLHVFRGGQSGKGNEIMTELQASFKWFDAIIEQICDGFLTKREQKQMREGKDFWLLHDEVIERLVRMDEVRSAAIAAEAAAAGDDI